MRIFTIDGDDNITVHATRKAARSTGAATFSSLTEFAERVGSDSKRLVAIWNSLPGVPPVTRFTSRKVATERIWSAIQSLGDQPGTTISQHASGIDLEAKTGDHAAVPRADSTPLTEPAVPAPLGPGMKRVKKQPTPAQIAPRAVTAPREISKRAQVLALLSAPRGVTLAELMTVTGWQKHSVRGFISGALVKKGIAVQSFKRQDGERTYRILA